MKFICKHQDILDFVNLRRPDFNATLDASIDSLVHLESARHEHAKIAHAALASLGYIDNAEDLMCDQPATLGSYALCNNGT